MNVYWTRERMILAAQQWAAEYGSPPKASQWTKSTLTHPHNSMVRARFGNWNLLIVAAGFKPRAHHAPGNEDVWPRERIIAACQLFAQRNGRTPRTRDWQIPHPDYPHRDTAWARFGSWNAMLRAAGFEPQGTHPPRRWTRDKVAEAFLDFLLREGRWPRTRDCEGDLGGKLPHRLTVYRIFGSWDAAKKHAGWDPQPPAAPVPLEWSCSGCGTTNPVDQTARCKPCSDRLRKRRKRLADPAFRESERLRRREYDRRMKEAA